MSTEATKKPRLLRRKWVVRPTYQNQFAVVLVAFQINVGLLYLGIMQFRMRSLLEQAGSLQVLLETNLWSAFLPWIAAISGALGAIVWMIGLFFSNSIVGPIPRLQSALQAMAAGDFSQRLKFRPGDALEDLATDVNALAERLANGTIGEELADDASDDRQDEAMDAPEPTGVGV
jgi:methyl-accepting chemotaxis protein